MFKICIITAVFTISAVYGSGEFTVLHHPNSMLFKGHEHLEESLLKEVYSAALGFSIEQSSNWPGLYLIDPFHLAEAVATVAVDGISDMGHGKGHHFPLRTDEDEIETFSAMEKRVEERNPSRNSHIVRVDLSQGLEGIGKYQIFKGIKDVKAQKSNFGHLKLNIDEDREFLEELALLEAIVGKIESGVIKRDYISDVFWFKVSTLHALSDLHGENSTAVKEAKQLLSEAVMRLNNAFNKAYNGKCLVSVIASDAVHTRRTRSLLQVITEEQEVKPNLYADLNLAKTYDQNYPAIFNIILWFGVIMVFSLIAIAIVIGDMDPGRDSIIYRMTSTRMKKDN